MINLTDPREIDNFFNAKAVEQDSGNTPEEYSRKVALLKIVLPIVAAVLGLTLLFFPTLKKDINEFAIDLVIPDGNIEKMNAEDTSLYVTDSKGRTNNFSAKSIKETAAGSQMYELNTLEAMMPVVDGEWLNLRSPDGIYNQQTETLQLPRKVELFYSKGFNIETRNFFYDFKTSSGYSKNPVIGHGFLGYLNSEGMELSVDQNVITFVGKTSIIIDEDSLKKESE